LIRTRAGCIALLASMLSPVGCASLLPVATPTGTAGAAGTTETSDAGDAQQCQALDRRFGAFAVLAPVAGVGALAGGIGAAATGDNASMRGANVALGVTAMTFGLAAAVLAHLALTSAGTYVQLCTENRGTTAAGPAQAAQRR
jgi:hypothetical protein